jgi:ferredoxin
MENTAPLRGIICYYSGSGNTRLACQYLQNKVKNVTFDLFNIVRGGTPELAKYDVVGFATFTDFCDPPHLVRIFINKLDHQADKPAFVFNTYGFISGRTLLTLDKWATAKGFKVVAGHSLHTPESYPPMVAGGRGNEQAPSERELRQFNQFIAGLDEVVGHLKEGRDVIRKKSSIGFLNSLIPSLSRTRSRDDMGIKYVDAALCDECGICGKLCPYDALKLDPKPVFDMKKCYGCWSCYNHCPHKAIYTKKYRGVGHYPKTIERLKDKLAF